MDEDDKELLIQTSERSKSNTHQIDEIKNRMDKLEQKTEDIHKIATTIEVVCNDIGYIKEGQNELNNKFDNLSNKVDNQGVTFRSELQAKVNTVQKQVDKLHDEPYNEYKQTKHNIKVNILSAIGKVVGLGIIAYFCALIGSGAIKL
jgi:uncharacterized coiled-coil DUF342 family protein